LVTDLLGRAGRAPHHRLAKRVEARHRHAKLARHRRRLAGFRLRLKAVALDAVQLAHEALENDGPHITRGRRCHRHQIGRRANLERMQSRRERRPYSCRAARGRAVRAATEHRRCTMG